MTAAHDATHRKRVNALIDFYEASRPDAGQRIDLAFTPRQLCKLFDVPCQPTADRRRQVWPDEIAYRGRLLHATKR